MGEVLCVLGEQEGVQRLSVCVGCNYIWKNVYVR